MTTITVKNSEKLLRKNFQDLEDLRNYLASLDPQQAFQLSIDEEAELDRRYEDIKSGKEKGISWENIKAKFEARITS